jgi:hypothetical protein
LKWAHEFAYVENGRVIRMEPLVPGTVAAWPSLREFEQPITIERFIFEMVRIDGYEFCGSYPKGNGVVILLKLQRKD